MPELPGPEIDLLLALSRIDVDDATVARCASLLHEGGRALDWAYFFDQALRHKVLPLVARNLDRHGLFTDVEEPLNNIPGRWAYLAAYRANLERNQHLLEELAVVVRAIRATGVLTVVRKGGAMLGSVYRDLGIRRMNDLDLLVRRDDIGAVAEVLTELGYQQGRVSPNRRVVEPERRSKEIYWQLYMGNLRPFVRPTSEPTVELFEVDICFSQFLPKSGYQIPTDGLEGKVREIDVAGERAWAFAPEEMVIDLCAHLYKEATALWWIQNGLDLNLIKFCDIAEYVRACPIDWDDLVARVRTYGVGDPCYYSLHFTDVLYPGVVPAEALDALRPDDTTYLDEYGSVDLTESQRWDDGFVERMFNSRRRLLAPTSSAPS